MVSHGAFSTVNRLLASTSSCDIKEVVAIRYYFCSTTLYFLEKTQLLLFCNAIMIKNVFLGVMVHF